MADRTVIGVIDVKRGRGVSGTIADHLAQRAQPWPETAACSLRDFLADGWAGDSMRVPVQKPGVGGVAAFERFTHPLNPDRLQEEAGDLRRNTHFVDVEPDDTVPLGRIVFLRRANG
jgi:hypothetical protein